MRRNKHLRPELREQYAHWEQEFMAMHRKKHTILFLIWLIVWLAFAACVLFLEPNIIISFCFMLWAIAGLTGTLIFNHRCIQYVESHVYDNPDGENTGAENYGTVEPGQEQPDENTSD